MALKDVEPDDNLLDRLELAETIAAIREGMDDAVRGEAMTLQEAEIRLRDKYGFRAG
jgi:predicted transcriptional regulator